MQQMINAFIYTSCITSHKINKLYRKFIKIITCDILGLNFYLAIKIRYHIIFTCKEKHIMLFLTIKISYI